MDSRDLYHLLPSELGLSEARAQVILRTPSAPKIAAYANLFKPLIDGVVASILLVCCFPILLVAALLISIESVGAPIYMQRRVGRNSRHFTLYKLRTMYQGSESAGFRTSADDARITWLGSFLRDTKIDELPQLWNVIRGDMSLIGPRPLSVEETDHLIEQDFSPEHRGLVPTVLPGMTGLEQCTRSSLHSYDHRFFLNQYYEENVSLWLDLWVVRRTLLVCPLVCIGMAASVSMAVLVAIAPLFQ